MFLVFIYAPLFFFFQAEDGIRDGRVTGVQTCALPIAALGLARARPAATARVGAGLDPHGAGGAADRRVTLIDERVDQHAVLFDVGVHLLLGPGGDRVDLD